MISAHLVDPAIQPILNKLPSMEFSIPALPVIRDAINKAVIIGDATASTSSVITETMLIPRADGQAPMRVLCYRSAKSQGIRPAMLHIHGGGYVVGTPEMMAPANRELCVELSCAIFSVDYRLAPEAPFPSGLEDCYAALTWLHEHASQLEIDARHIGVKGESAGGGLAAALALLVRDRGEVHLAFQHLLYPMLDDRTCVDHSNPYAGEYLWTRAHNAFGWRSLLGVEPGSPEVSPYAAPARAKDLSNLPPAFISVGSLDLFVDEDIEYGHRLLKAGVPVEMHVYPGGPHGFDNMPNSAIATAGQRHSRDALQKALSAAI